MTEEDVNPEASAALTRAVRQADHRSCWLCAGLGSIAVHSLWSAKRGKPLWTAHKPTSTSHPVHPCPACRPPVMARLALLEDTTARVEDLVDGLEPDEIVSAGHIQAALHQPAQQGDTRG